VKEREDTAEEQVAAQATACEELSAARERLQMLSRELVGVQEDERRALARELNDGAGQTLTSIKIGLRLLERGSGNEEVRAQALQLQQTADRLQERLSRLAANLRPPALDHLGLAAALGQLVEEVPESSGVEAQFEAIGLSDERLPDRIETELFRIAQEAVGNAIRHAAADHVAVILRRRDALLRLVVEDDGIGFDAAAAGRAGRLGLVMLRERAEALGGTLLIESAAGLGTIVIVEVPVA
jgi:signal transduction histidine kinase